MKGGEGREMECKRGKGEETKRKERSREKEGLGK